MTSPLGQRLVDARKAAGLTRPEAAARTDTPVRTLARWEHGQTEPPATKLGLLARTYGVSADELLDLDPPTRSDRLLYCEDALARLEAELDRGARIHDVARRFLSPPGLNVYWVPPGVVRPVGGEARRDVERRLRACVKILHP